MTNLPTKVVFLDVEATGLEKTSKVIEVAAIFTTLASSGVYVPTEIAHWLSSEVIYQESLSPDIVTMHNSNYLFDDMLNSGTSENDLYQRILSRIDSRHYVAGRCVFLDQEWIDRNFGIRVGGHRVIDVSTLALTDTHNFLGTHKGWAKLLHQVKNVPMAVTGRHRALRDTLDDLMAVNNYLAKGSPVQNDATNVLRSLVQTFCEDWNRPLSSKAKYE